MVHSSHTRCRRPSTRRPTRRIAVCRSTMRVCRSHELDAEDACGSQLGGIVTPGDLIGWALAGLLAFACLVLAAAMVAAFISIWRT
ncbi:hypothetical protein O156_gp31 [Mycobacterium phage LittleCherry]|uniref:Uncharacterized protein n=1 Tax=Mycobacterium phage LittleCherry TaxID=1340818 RepID=S5Z3G7_9CAUD|nr:hypothetical protein O156_gp31 [Mycobacterium phage LittleCherry]AGT11946.1 hypothetical protein PBI_LITTLECHERRY_63 [Mycobacterium phage LittleCherry]